MTFFEENKGCLARLFPSFKNDVLDRYRACECLEWVQTPSGLPSAKYDGRLLHSARSPMEEARRLAAKLDLDKASYVVIAGFGLGYLAEACLAMNEHGQVIVLEPDIPLFLEALKSRSLTGVLGSPRLSLLLNADPSVLQSLLPPVPSGPIKLVKYRPLYDVHQIYYDKVENTVAAFLARREINENTLNRFGRLWVRNMFANLPVFYRAKPIAALSNAFTGLPGLVLAAGPSLDEVIPLLKRLKERFVIVAVDTALNACLSGEITPDFLVVVDPQYWNLRHLDRLTEVSPIIVSEASSHPGVFRRHGGEVFFCSSIFPLSRYFEEAVGKLGKLGAGGSVATTAWDFARVAGLQPIYMAGLDLGFPGKATHYRGSFFEQRSLSLSGRSNPAETMSFRYIHDAGPYYEENNSGGRTLTDKRLSMYKNWFEQQFVMYPETDNRTLSAQGLRIRGLEPENTLELLAYPPARHRIDEVLENVRTFAQSDPVRAEQSIESAAETLRQSLVNLKTSARKAADLTILFGRLAEQGSDTADIVARLERADRDLRSSLTRDIAGFLAQQSARTILSGSNCPVSAKDVAYNSLAMYEELISSADYHLSLLEAACLNRCGAGPSGSHRSRPITCPFNGKK